MILAFLFTSTASAALMCGLTESEVEDIIDYYGYNTTFEDVEPLISTPFECYKYGNLCDIVGGSRAPTFLCSVWDDAVARESEVTIDANALSTLDSLSDAWEAELFPSGISDSDPWWGAPPPSTGCEPVVYDKNGSETRKIRGKSYWVTTGIYNYIGGSTKGYVKSGGSWTRDYSGYVEVSPTFIRLDSYSSECRYSRYKDDDDGKVNKNSWSIFVFPEKWVETTSEYSGLSVDTCKTAPWGDPGC